VATATGFVGRNDELGILSLKSIYRKGRILAKERALRYVRVSTDE
jgi:hypothetical protein